jgi:hypothetical protein
VVVRGGPQIATNLFTVDSAFKIGGLDLTSGQTAEAKLYPGVAQTFTYTKGQKVEPLGITLTATLNPKLPGQTGLPDGRPGQLLDIYIQRTSKAALRNPTNGSFNLGPITGIKFSTAVKIKASFFYFTRGSESFSGLKKDFAGLALRTGLDPTSISREVYTRGTVPTNPVREFSPLTAKGLNLNGKDDFRNLGLPNDIDGIHIDVWVE